MFIYNVTVFGKSIGMTFKRAEAESWAKASMADSRFIKIHSVPYKESTLSADMKG